MIKVTQQHPGTFVVDRPLLENKKAKFVETPLYCMTFTDKALNILHNKNSP